MMAVIVDYMLKMCLLLSIFFPRGLPNATGPKVTYLLTSLGALINALKKLTLRQL